MNAHLRKYIELHPHRLNDAITGATGAKLIRWIGRPEPNAGRELKGIEFVEDRAVNAAWSRFWPQRGNPPNWDAVGQADLEGAPTWVLVEAKAHIGELKSDCKAVEAGGLGTIRDTFAAVKERLGVAPDRDWLRGYYQFCNRLAVLGFLNDSGIPAILVLIYFCGDCRPDTAVCPKDEQEWATALEQQATHVGLPPASPLNRRVHKVFLPVLPNLTSSAPS